MKILRTIGILALVAGLMLGGAGSAFAQEEEPELAEIEGVIKAIDTEAGTVTIAPEKGKAAILTITGDTEINKDEEPATIKDLAKDDEVEALYNPETLEAVKIVAKSPEPAEKGGPAGGPPKRGPHSPKHGLFGTVLSPVVTVSANVTYYIDLATEDWGTVVITADNTTKYMVPRETHGPKDLDTFLGIVTPSDDDLEELVGRRLALLVTPLTVYASPPPDYTATAIKLMLIPSHSSPPSHAHRVGIVQAFTAGSITIIDKDGESHTFDLNETVYRPYDIDMEAVIGGYVTVVTKGDAGAKAIVLHDELPDWAP